MLKTIDDIVRVRKWVGCGGDRDAGNDFDGSCCSVGDQVIFPQIIHVVKIQRQL